MLEEKKELLYELNRLSISEDDNYEEKALTKLNEYLYKDRDIEEISKLILDQIDHNRSVGKADKFTLEEIDDIIKRRIVPSKLDHSSINKMDCGFEDIQKYLSSNMLSHDRIISIQHIGKKRDNLYRVIFK